MTAPKKKRGNPGKNPWDYLAAPSSSHVNHEQYVTSPAEAFLKYLGEAYNAYNNCLLKLKNRNGTFYRDGKDSIQHIMISMIPAIMGHFETYQRHLFAGMFDFSVMLKDFEVKAFMNNLQEKDIKIDIVRLSAYRNLGTQSIGVLLADSMQGWHDPCRVNRYLSYGQTQVFTSKDEEWLSVIWQFRHSIVHTGGTLTWPDAQKIKSLSAFAGRQLVFDEKMMNYLCRRFHTLTRDATDRAKAGYKKKLEQSISKEDEDAIDELFFVSSKIKSWL